MEVKIHSGSQKVPRQWHKFLSAGSNKERLAEFLFSEWQSDKYAEKLVNRSLYMTHGKYCHKLTSHGHIVAEQVDELQCSHEEADTRILLHAKHASASTDQIVIRSPDTDVAVLACAFHGDIPANILFYTGTKHRTRYINIDSISESIGGNVCQALLGMHAFTGCVSTSVFVGKGKKKAFELIKTESTCVRQCTTLAKSLPPMMLWNPNVKSLFARCMGNLERM